ncbi:hypothetical protein CBR_g17099 [Chara braunii]|uniref:Uncharacterized protein n=1 Tax=Chara braunii TaxID=69332 RepID=A0A388KUN7_CHABU|nr:hypothetical protein CBR_g17099 [Chara braunii]|eukprot:GBG73759.1 hypothetical protein CBR_g17099 [Chara braunii]
MQKESNKYVLYFIYLALVALGASYAEVAFWMQTSDRQSLRLREAYLRSLLKQEVGYFDTQTGTGEIISRMWGDAVLVQDAIGEKFGVFLQFLSLFAAGFCVGFSGVWELALITLVVIPALAVAGGSYVYVLSGLNAKAQQAYTGAGQVALQTLSSIRTVYSFVGEDKALDAYSKALEKTLALGVKGGFTKGVNIGVTYAIMFSSWALNFWYAGRLVAKRKATPGEAMTTMFSVLFGGMALGQAMPYISYFAKGRAAGYKIFQAIKREPMIHSDGSGRELQKLRGEIQMIDVAFRYPARPDVLVFRNFSLTIPAGKVVALVGPSGSGKSSVVALLERFYEPESGSILIDGVDIKNLQLRWLRRQIGLVSQEPVLFATSIIDNILYGRDGASKAEVEAAAKGAHAHNFIMQFPKGYDTTVGERGVQMSGGQKQRIAIARAMLKNPTILLLDEATSALDAESERVVQEALDALMVGRSTVVIAHRLSTIQRSNMIAVVQGGEVVETGTHEELLAREKSGTYAKLIKLQVEGNIMEQDGSVLGSSQRRGSITVPTPRNEPETSPATVVAAVVQPLRNASFSVSMAGNYSGDIEGTGAPSFCRLLKLNRREWHWGLLGMIAASVCGAFQPGFSLILSSVISKYFNPDTDEMQKEVRRYCLIFLGFAAMSTFAYGFNFGSFSVAGERLVKRVREKCFKALLTQEVGWFDRDDNSSASIAARLEVDATVVKSAVAERISVLVQCLALVVISIVIGLLMTWKMTLVMLATMPLVLSGSVGQNLMMKGFAGNLVKAYERASAIAGEAVANIRTVQAFCAEEKVVSLFAKEVDIPMRNSFRRGQMAGLVFGISQMLLYASFALVLWYGMTLVRDRETDFGKMFKTFMVLVVASFGISEALTLAPDILRGSQVLASVFGIMDRKTLIDADDKKGAVLNAMQGAIEMRKVKFSYPSRPMVMVLQDMSLEVKPGQKVALVGASGSGKSSVIGLIERFYDPTSGEVLIDGHDIRALNLRWVRRHIGLVSQEPMLFGMSIKDNIMYGKELAMEDEIVQAAKRANAHSFINALPRGYDTQVGEAGVQMSGGQKQRIAIARAVLKNPIVLLLDEATSALDAASERLVQEALDQLMVGRTTIIVAHRLSTIRDADVIIVMHQGLLVEQGNHKELMAKKGGAYASLVSLQQGDSKSLA